MSIGEENIIAPIADMSGKLSDHITVDENNQTHLLGTHCSGCGIHFFPVRAFCPKCTSDDLKSIKLPRVGKLYTYSTVHISPTRKVPYHLGYIDLPNNVRLLSVLRGEPKSFDIGSSMEVDSEDGDWFFSKVGAL